MSVLVERYAYAPGPATAMPMHVHDEWQWCLYVGGPGSYRLRRGSVAFPSGTLTVLPPGEPHAAADPCDRRAPSWCLVAYLPEPAPTIVDDARLRSAFRALWDPAAQDDALALLLSPRAPATPSRALIDARDYLHAHAFERVPLATLAGVAGLSSAHLVRAFGRAYGLPPHRYQLGLRVERGKRLLAAGVAVGEVALTVGFSDQAHFGRTFRRWVGVSPGRYAKNVQDRAGRVRFDRTS